MDHGCTPIPLTRAREWRFAKNRSPLQDRAGSGRSGGGLCFGYAVLRMLDAAGEVVRGERRINEAEAVTVRRIFEEFASGLLKCGTCDGGFSKISRFHY